MTPVFGQSREVTEVTDLKQPVTLTVRSREKMNAACSLLSSLVHS